MIKEDGQMTTKLSDENAAEPTQKKDDEMSAEPAQKMSFRHYCLSLGFKVLPPTGKGFVIGTGGKPKK